MVKIKKFEDIESWKKARKLTNEIYQATSSGGFSRDFDLKNQIRRASVSILSNIAEGFERGGKAEFINFLTIANGSCAETRSQLYSGFDRNYYSEQEMKIHLELAEEIGRMIGGLINYLNRSELKGRKFKDRVPSTQNSKPQTQN